MTHNSTLSLLALILLVFSYNATAQDTLVLMNGKVLDVRITDDTGANIFFEAEKKNGKTKIYQLYKPDIFSVSKQGQQESLLYVQDELNGNDLTIDEMRHMIYGQNDAREGFNVLPTMIGGFIVGAGAGASDAGFIPFLVMPPLYSFVMQIRYIRIKEETISNKEFSYHEFYKEGYNKTARSKKFVKAFVSTFAGVVVGTTVLELTNK